jgi:hypothetical protein
MFETMLRSGVPPHMGQSPVPGSAAFARRVNEGAARNREINAREAMITAIFLVVIILYMAVD